LMTGIASLHGSNLMDLAPTQTDPLTNSLIPTLMLSPGSESIQNSVPLYQSKWLDFEAHVEAPLNLTDKAKWKVLGSRSADSIQFSGRMIGGCLDTIARLVGTPYGDLPTFIKQHQNDGVIFYFENCELPPCELARTLWNLRLAGWFRGLSGLLIGRSAGPDANREENLSYVEALQSVLGDLGLPILYDVDIGHRPPQFSIINGSLGTVSFENGAGSLRQKLI
jgi:muramoyltetrapeptide carboxypeptidase